MALSDENAGILEAELFEVRHHLTSVIGELDEMPDGDDKIALRKQLVTARSHVVESLDALALFP